MSTIVDVSEIKTYRECKRKHQFSSRNRWHLRNLSPNDNLIFGVQFHECLHSAYLGANYDKVKAFIDKEVTDPTYNKIMTKMIEGYYSGVLPDDLQRYQIIDIEKSFAFPGAFDPDTGEVLITFKGSIDMVAIDKLTNQLVGFEHKSTKNFRPAIYNLIDEQPRMYAIALKHILEDYHKAGRFLDVLTVGPIFLNQVRKLSTKFDFARVPCTYSDRDLENFFKGCVNSAMAIRCGTASTPEPGMMKCQQCDYATLCEFLGYDETTLDEVLKEFDGEYAVREMDHLEEKVEREA